jgi:ATP-binding cassette subfamily F protein uup
MQVRFLLATPLLRIPSRELPDDGAASRYNARFIDLLTVRFPGARLCLHNMAVISLSSAQLAFGHVALLDHADFSLETGERVGLIGRNGTGKSSLLKVRATTMR